MEPVLVVKSALCRINSTCQSQALRPRFKLIIDCTEDDSILRLLSSSEVVDASSRCLFKLSNLSKNSDLERLQLVAGIKFAAMQGNFAVLSQTEPVNESFYDLFNQRFREITSRDGVVTLYANIAMGGISRRSLVRPDFECVIHVRESNLPDLPAPFLNRFEKYRLTLSDVLASGWSKDGALARIVAVARKRAADIADALKNSAHGDFGWVGNPQTLESIFVGMLPSGSGGGESDSCPDAAPKDLKGALVEFLEASTSLLDIKVHVENVVSLAVQVLPDILSRQLSHLTAGTAATEASFTSKYIQSILSTDGNRNTLAPLIGILVQMVFTRAAAMRLLQLVTPETIFLKRHLVPSDVVHGYFEQEHFSLKRVLALYSAGTSNRNSLTVVHTRSDCFIHCIPRLAPDRSTLPTSSIQNVRNWLHDEPDVVVCEHVSKLQSESDLRGVVKLWVQHASRNMLVLLVDMNVDGALDQVNFVRTCLEQELAHAMGKSFFLLLHYSPTTLLSLRSYPALFLGGWEHVFLDGVGNETASVQVDRFIARACSTGNCSTGLGQDESAKGAIQAVLARLLPHLAGQKLFYRDGNVRHLDSFQQRKNRLDHLLAVIVGDSTIRDILSEKFVTLWFASALLKTTQRAAEALLTGATRLSMSMSVHSFLVQTLQAFVTDLLMQANQWKNLDLLDAENEAVLLLFGLILKGLPVLPFEELLLQRSQSTLMRLLPLPTLHVDCDKPRFPFFYFVSSCLDEVTESAHNQLLSANTGSLASEISMKDCFRAAIDILESDSVAPRHHKKVHDRRKLTSEVVLFVFKDMSKSSTEPSLFDRYLEQFVEWKVGCLANEGLRKWWTSLIVKCGDGSYGNIVAIHVVARLQQLDTMRVASILSISESFPFVRQAKLAAALNERLNFCAVLLDSIEEVVVSGTYPGTIAWPVVISTVTDAAALAAEHGRKSESLACRLRRLSFFSLRDSAASSPIPDCYDSNETFPSKGDFTLARYLESIAPAERELSKVTFFLRFLSPTWLDVTDAFWLDDVRQLVQSICKGGFACRTRVAVGLLRSGCRQEKSTMYGHFCMDALLIVNDQLSTMNASAPGGVLHYIPEWLRGVNAELATHPAKRRFSFGTYFGNYAHAFEGYLPEILFDMFLSMYAAEAENASSDQIYLTMVSEMQSELTYERPPKEVQASRTDLRGTPLAAIALSARLLCWIAKVATEIAVHLMADVLEGPHAHDASRLLSEMMELPGVCWSDFFIHTILRLRGEGTLSSALTGPLSREDWCRPWIEGMPEAQLKATSSLRGAESDLAEAVAEEEQKSNELRHCPHCQQLFDVAKRNCGQFICGRDFHRSDWRGSTEHGCGAEFQVDTAQPYRVDESRLVTLRARISDETSKLSRCDEFAVHWTRAKTMAVPGCCFLVCSAAPDQILPSKQMISSTPLDDEGSPIELMRVLWDASDLAPRLRILPDLIELYVWLHDTFRFLITKDAAFTTTMGDLMIKERLGERYDEAKVDHVLALWSRIKSGWNPLLRSDRIVHWDCEEVTIPFDKVENARLVFLLSEGSHPTDGNDFLFLWILETVTVFNKYAEKLASFSTTGDPNAVNLQPRFIIRGFSGAAKLGSIVPVPQDHLNWVAECSWDSEKQAFDSETVAKLLMDTINLHERPFIISNPLKDLREKFLFRDDTTVFDSNAFVSGDVTRSKHGHFFANYQDAQLVDEVYQLLDQVGADTSKDELRRTLIDNFYGLDYDRIRALLEGCRCFLDLLLNFGRESFQSVGLSLEGLMTTSDSPDSDDAPLLNKIGFPIFTEPQERLILSLDMPQFAGMVQFAEYQLASEAYLYSNLPPYVTDPLKEKELEELKVATLRLVDVVGQINEFVRDVLSFYEVQIVRDASRSNQSLQAFLSENNFCDASDPVFAAIPNTVTVRNYISLCQALHQVKLKHMLQSTGAGQKGTAQEVEREKSFATIAPGRCWLWEDENVAGSGNDPGMARLPTDSNDQLKLWFEQSLEKSPKAELNDDSAMPEDTVNVESGPMMRDSMIEEVEMQAASPNKKLESTCHSSHEVLLPVINAAATTLQHWWRQLRAARIASTLDQAMIDAHVGDNEDAEEMSQDEMQALDEEAMHVSLA